MNVITKEELLEKIRRKEAFHLVDVAGAIHLLISEMTEQKVESMFGKEDLIVTYSLDVHCPAKNIAAKKLRDYGYANVLAYQGSWREWKEAGYPVEKG